MKTVNQKRKIHEKKINSNAQGKAPVNNVSDNKEERSC